MAKKRKKLTKKERLLSDIKAIMHAEYDHTKAVFYGRKRYLKEEKRFKKKADRRRQKQSLRNYY